MDSDVPMRREHTAQPEHDSTAESAIEPVSSYLQRHRIHVLVDRLVRDLLEERPADSGAWMQRWLLEEHRQECAEKHSRSPHASSTIAAASGQASCVEAAEPVAPPFAANVA